MCLTDQVKFCDSSYSEFELGRTEERGRGGGGGRLAPLFWVAMQRRVFILFIFDFVKTASLNGPEVFGNIECLYTCVYI